MKLAPRIPLPQRSPTADGVAISGIAIAVLLATVGAAIIASGLAVSGTLSLTLGVFVLSANAIGVLVISHRREHDAFSPLGLICLFNVATFGVGALYYYNEPWPGGLPPYVQSDIAPSVWLGVIGLAMLTLGYWINPFRVVIRRLPKFASDVASRKSAIVISTLLVVGWGARAYAFATGRYFYGDAAATPINGGSWLVSAATDLPLLAAAYCGARYYFARRAGLSYGSTRAWYYLLLLVEVAYYAPTARRTSLLAILMMILVLRYYALQVRPSLVSLLVMITLAVVVVFPVLDAYRNPKTGTAYQNNLGENMLRATQSLASSSPRESVDLGLSSTFQRFSGVTSVAAFRHYGPDALGRRRGETLSWLYTGLLPRAIAPNKPNPGAFGNEIALKFAIANPGPVRTSVTVTPVGEMYLNYRVPGIIIGLFVLGGMYRIISAVLAGRAKEPLVLALYASVAWTLINAQEAIVAGGVLGTIKEIGVLGVALAGAARLQALWSR